MAGEFTSAQCLRTYPSVVNRMTFKMARIAKCKTWLNANLSPQQNLVWPIPVDAVIGDWQELNGNFYFRDRQQARMFSRKFPIL
jgi:hypothetical protein